MQGMRTGRSADCHDLFWVQHLNLHGKTIGDKDFAGVVRAKKLTAWYEWENRLRHRYSEGNADEMTNKPIFLLF
jgi:hypothetical protein